MPPVWLRSHLLEAAEHNLDAVAAFVPTLVVFDGHGPGFPARNARLDAPLLQGIPEPVRIIASVCQHPLRLGQLVEQCRRTGVIADWSRRGEEAQRAAIGVGDGVKLGVHAALRASDQSAEIPFFTRRLEAVRCAFK